MGGIAVGGMWFQPHLTKDVVHLVPARRGDVNLENIQKVISGMFGVVNEGGTGVRARLPGIDVCGKTGSAQLVSNDAIKAGYKQGKDMKDNAWFVGFAPRQAPEIVVAALFENGEHGQLAAPIVRDVMKAYFDKKARLAQPEPQIASLPPQQLLRPPVPPSAAVAVNP
jgi:penicillin-binding protein 2